MQGERKRLNRVFIEQYSNDNIVIRGTFGTKDKMVVTLQKLTKNDNPDEWLTFWNERKGKMHKELKELNGSFAQRAAIAESQNST
jgi:hypothetical protein